MPQPLEEGDLFERSEAMWLRTRLPLYETIWSEFIGHDGRGHHARSFAQQDEEVAERHAMFRQCHYSMALFLKVFDASTTESLSYLQRQQTPLTAEAYLDMTQRTSTFLALMGQVCDMVEAIANALKASSIFEPVAPFMKERNQSIHAARIPMGIDYVGIFYAAIAKSEAEPGYRNRIAWEKVEVQESKYAEDWFDQTRQKLIETIAAVVLPLVFQNCKRMFNVPLPQPQKASQPASSNVSAFTPISGAMSQPKTVR